MIKMNMKKTIASILAATMAVSMLSVNVSAAMSVKRHVWTDKYGKEHTHYCDYKDSEFCTLQKIVDLKDEYGYSYIERPTSTTNSNSNSISSKYSSSDKVDRIVKMKYYGKAITSAPITSDAKFCSSVQYAVAQGASSIKLNYDSSYTTAMRQAFDERNNANFGDTTLLCNMMKASASARYSENVNFRYNLTAKFVYAYRYNHPEIIKKEDKFTQELYKKCVEVLKECGVNDKNKSDMEIILNIQNWTDTEIETNAKNAKMPYDEYKKLKNSTEYKNYLHKSVYQAMICGFGCCGNYTDTFMLLTRMAGYKCWYIEGNTDPTKGWGGNGHVWNAIRINGELRFVEPQLKGRIMTYDELSDYGYIPTMTGKELEMYCKY